VGPTTPEAVFAQIRQTVHGYDVPLAVVETGGAAHTVPLNGQVRFQSSPDLVRSAQNTLFTSGTLGRYSNMLKAVIESPGELYDEPIKQVGVRPGSVQVEEKGRE
jgi:NADH-quinone oxidoreductase subunit G